MSFKDNLTTYNSTSTTQQHKFPVGGPVPAADLQPNFNTGQMPVQPSVHVQGQNPPAPPPRTLNKIVRDGHNSNDTGNGREMSSQEAAVAQLANLQRYPTHGTSAASATVGGGHHHHHHHYYHSFQVQN
jgi:hypothetical protein